jgi:Xaa-Pro aminopeptidase
VTLRTDTDLLARLARPPRAARAGLRAPRAARRHAARAKLARCARRWRAHGATHHFVSTVDDIAWITNLRGSDVTTTRCSWPTCWSTPPAATLFVGEPARSTPRW